MNECNNLLLDKLGSFAVFFFYKIKSYAYGIYGLWKYYSGSVLEEVGLMKTCKMIWINIMPSTLETVWTIPSLD